MTAFPNGIETRKNAIRLLGAIDGREQIDMREWDIDDFMSIPHSDPAINRCRLRVANELINLLSSRDQTLRQRITPLVSELIAELENNASD
ncbi:hypothetical protein GGR90_002490 [Sphingopyxis italica]|uniref:Uncharacterized protein n=1 Tax=Sphingopyxis italica TaxID=1129133 RepID=A0A7X5XSP2_9SPHN|nr:hypothetical protein [Sphingopyxis italica]NJB90296.1 hypothetical protein [Sphingopyxis italica]